MGWGINLYPQIYYSKVDFRSKWDVERKIEETKNVIKMLEKKLLALVMTTEPAKMMPKDWEDSSPAEWLMHEFENITEGYDDSLKGYYYDLWKLELLRDNWDAAHNEDGKAIHHPKGSFEKWDRAYMDGDFIDSVYEDGTDPYSKEATYEGLDPLMKEKVDNGELIWSKDFKDFVAP